jgi:hypothetical protein
MDAKSYLTGVFPLRLETQEGLIDQLVQIKMFDLPDDYLETYRAKVRAITPEDLLNTARQYLDSANMQIVVVGDRAQIESQARLFGDLEIYDARRPTEIISHSASRKRGTNSGFMEGGSCGVESPQYNCGACKSIPLKSPALGAFSCYCIH